MGGFEILGFVVSVRKQCTFKSFNFFAVHMRAVIGRLQWEWIEILGTKRENDARVGGEKDNDSAAVGVIPESSYGSDAVLFKFYL